MKIRQCFLELQLKMSGMFLRHTVLWLILIISQLIDATKQKRLERAAVLVRRFDLITFTLQTLLTVLKDIYKGCTRMGHLQD